MNAKHEIRVLLIESNNQVAAAVVALLHDRGVEVEVIADGHGAEAAIERYAPHVVVVDFPPGNGRETFQKIRSRWPRLPVIVCSAERPNVQHLLAAERTAFLAKPFDGDTVMEAIHRLLGSR